MNQCVTQFSGCSDTRHTSTCLISLILECYDELINQNFASNVVIIPRATSLGKGRVEGTGEAEWSDRQPFSCIHAICLLLNNDSALYTTAVRRFHINPTKEVFVGVPIKPIDRKQIRGRNLSLTFYVGFLQIFPLISTQLPAPEENEKNPHHHPPKCI